MDAKPLTPPWPYLDHPGPLALAHQGGALEAPANTMAAFTRAVETLGYKYLETDLQCTSDGVLVTFHDNALDPSTDARGVIAALPWSAVKQAKVGGTEPIARLDELLAAWPDVKINLDPKRDSVVRPLAGILERGGQSTIRRVGVGSFSDRRLAQLRKLVGPELCTSLGPIGTARWLAAGWGVPVVPAFRAGSAQVPVRYGKFEIVNERSVKAAHRAGLQVHVWTIDDGAEMARLLDLGVDGIITDRPSVLKALLVERGLWV